MFHAARQDIEIFVKLTGKVPLNIFDTQIAASVCGFGDSVTYDNLVRSITSVELDKSSRFTDWSHRPLTEKQRLYALADVTHLRDIYVKLRQAGRRRRTAGTGSRTNSASCAPSTPMSCSPSRPGSGFKTKLNRPRDLAALKELAAWRERARRTPTSRAAASSRTMR